MINTNSPDENKIFNRINSEKTKLNFDKPPKKTFWDHINDGLTSFNKFISNINNSLKEVSSSLDEELIKNYIKLLKLKLTTDEGSLFKNFQKIYQYKEFIKLFNVYVDSNKFSNIRDIEITIINDLQFDYNQYKEVIQSFKSINNEYCKVLNNLDKKEDEIIHLSNQYNTCIERINTFNLLFKLENNDIKKLVEFLEFNSEIIEIENKSFVLELFSVILKNPENHKIIRLSEKYKFDSLIENDKLFYTNELETIDNKYDYFILDLQNKVKVFKDNKIFQYLESITDKTYFNKLSSQIQNLLDLSNKFYKSNIISHSGIEFQNLKLELKTLENRLQELIDEKTEYLNNIEDFNTLYNLHLGEPLKDILNLKKEILYKQTIKQQKEKARYEDAEAEIADLKFEISYIKNQIDELLDKWQNIQPDDKNYNEIFTTYKELQDELEKLENELEKQEENLSKTKQEIENDEVFEEYEESKKQYEQFYQNYEDTLSQQADVFDITNEQKSELKKLLKKACKLCHPDIVMDKFKEKAHEIMQSLNNAYSKKDIMKVKEILSNLENGLTFEVESGDINDKEILKSKINQYKKNILELENEIEDLKDDKTYQTIQEINDIDVYFEELKSELQNEKDRLENKAKEILGNDKNWIDELTKKTTVLSDSNYTISDFVENDEINKRQKDLNNQVNEKSKEKDIIKYNLYVPWLESTLIDINNFPKFINDGDGMIILLTKYSEPLNVASYDSEDELYHDLDIYKNTLLDPNCSLIRVKDNGSVLFYDKTSSLYSELMSGLTVRDTDFCEEDGYDNYHLSNIDEQIENISIEKSDYSIYIQSIENINFEKIRRYCNNLLDDNQADEMQKYLVENGRMYKAIVYDALEQFMSKLDKKTITLLDWACEQGIGSMLVLDYIKEKQLDIIVNQIILLDDDTSTISRAMSQIEALKQNDIELLVIQNDTQLEVLKNIKNDVTLNISINDKMPINILDLDYDLLKNAYFMFLSNENENFINITYGSMNFFNNIEDISKRDNKIGRFDRYEKIFKINNKQNIPEIDIDEIPF